MPSHFCPDNLAYLRFRTLVGEHFDVIDWRHKDTSSDGDDQAAPVMVTLTDLTSGHTFTLALIDSLEPADARLLITATADGTLTTFGIYPSGEAAHAASTAFGMRGTVRATGITSLHPSNKPLPPTDQWLPTPDRLGAFTFDRVTADQYAVALVDYEQGRMLHVGPFDTAAAATAWTPVGVADNVQRHVTPIRPKPVHAEPEVDQP